MRGTVSRTVIGVLPERFQLPIDFDAETPTEVCVPLDVPEGLEPLPRHGGSHSYYAAGRLAERVFNRRGHYSVCCRR